MLPPGPGVSLAATERSGTKEKGPAPNEMNTNPSARADMIEDKHP